MAEKMGYDKDGNIVFFDENGNIVGEIYDPITARLKQEAEERKKEEKKERPKLKNPKPTKKHQ